MDEFKFNQPKLKESTPEQWSEYHRMRAKELQSALAAMSAERDRLMIYKVVAGRMEIERNAWQSRAERMEKALREEIENVTVDLVKSVSRAERLEKALWRIRNCHTDDECGFCGSLRIAIEALDDGKGAA